MRHRLLAVTRQEVAQPLNGFGKVPGPRQGDDPQMIRGRPVETGALGQQYLLLEQQIQDELLVIDEEAGIDRRRIGDDAQAQAGGAAGRRPAGRGSV